jgi:hypothetical protein
MAVHPAVRTPDGRVFITSNGNHTDIAIYLRSILPPAEVMAIDVDDFGYVIETGASTQFVSRDECRRRFGINDSDDLPGHGGLVGQLTIQQVE